MAGRDRSCPCCQSREKSAPVHIQRFDAGILGERYDIVVCPNCGMVYADGIPGQRELDRYYAEQSKYEYSHSDGMESKYDFLRFERIVDQVEAVLPDRQARILDVGCATGGLLARLKARGYRHLVGADPSSACSRAAQRMHGVEVRVGTIQEVGAWNESFDLILLVGVLEHLREPVEAAKVLSLRLSRDGLLYCGQPDLEQFLNCTNAPYQQFSMEHLNFFTPGSLANCMAAAGLAERRKWQWLVEWREGVTDSMISGLFGRPRVTPAMEKDSRGEPALRLYLERCREQDDVLVRRIVRLAAEHGEIILWGAGAQARRLVAEGMLGSLRIAAVVDQNPHLYGRTLGGISIVSPEAIARSSATIVICSQAFAAEIDEQIRSRWNLNNRVVRLFD